MPKKFALLIGLEAVDPACYDGKWNGFLHFAESDAKKVKRQIIDPLEFETTQMLLGADAKRNKVLQKLEAFADEAEEGDLVVVYYSGHGGQVLDLNDDELEKDGDLEDETWCLYDGQLLDDELWAAWSKFEKGVNILLLSDSCHSGTVAKNADGEPDETPKLIAEGAKIMPFEAIQAAYLKRKSFYDEISKNVPSPNTLNISASLISISACDDKELAYENPQWMQSEFTHAFIEAWQGGKFQGNYTEWLIAIKAQVTKAQTTQLNSWGSEAAQFLSTSPFSIAKSPSPGQAALDLPSPEELLIFSTPSNTDQQGDSFTSRSIEQDKSIQRHSIDSTQNAWDLAYAFFESLSPEQQSTTLIEPNLSSQSPVQEIQVQAKSRSASLQKTFLSTWPYPVVNNPISYTWHLSDDFSQLAQARDAVMAEPSLLEKPIRIGHLDTGYLDIDLFKPEHLLVDLGKNFAENNDDARDIDKKFAPFEQKGHGAATLAILAGPKVDNPIGMPGYSGYIGAIPFAEIIPLRIQDSVLLFKIDAIARAIQYAIEQGCEVLTMSMGGVPSWLWANVVNEAYMRGVTIVTATGNSMRKGWLKMGPKTVVYPARFERVIGAAGITYNHQPYVFAQNDWEEQFNKTAGGKDMQGNCGPDAHMWHVMSAYTPNVFWTDSGIYEDSEYPDPHFIMTGGGTSSATPQIAAAAALWIVKHRAELEQKGYRGTWKQVEAVRYALFKSAEKFNEHTGSIANAEERQGKYYSYMGQGALRAFKALEVAVPTEDQLQISPAAKIPRFPLISTLTKSRGVETASKSGEPLSVAEQKKQEMLSLELLQVLATDPDLEEFTLLNIDDEKFLEQLDLEQRNRLLEAIKNSKLASQNLKTALHDYFSK